MAIIENDDENGNAQSATPGLQTQQTGAVGSTSSGQQSPTGSVTTNSIQQNTGSQPLTTAGASSLVAGSAPGSGASGATAQGGQPNSSSSNQPQPSQFTNLSNYTTGNADNTNTLVNNLSNFYTNQADTAENALNTNVDQYSNLISGDTVNQNPTLMSQEAADPYSFAQNANNVSAYQALENANYTGPTSFESSQQYTNAQQPINTYDQYVQDLNSPTTYGNVLQSLYNGQPFSQGQQNLDVSLLQSNPNDLSQIQSTINGIGSLDNQLSNAATTEDAASQAAANTTAATATAAKNAITGQETGLQNTINQETQQDQKNATAQNSALQSLLTNVWNPAQTTTTTPAAPSVSPTALTGVLPQNSSFDQGSQAANQITDKVTAPGQGQVGIYNGHYYEQDPYLGTWNLVTNPSQITQFNGLESSNVKPVTTTTQAAGVATPSAADLQAMGLTAQQWQSLAGNITNYNNQYGAKYGDLTNLSGYLTNNGLGGITPNSVATTAQYNEQNALNTLGGSALPADDFISTPDQAASAPTSIDSFNYNQALKDVQQSMQSAQAAGANGQVKQSAGSSGGGLLQTIATVAVIGAVAGS